jgi:hypothetical protein
MKRRSLTWKALRFTGKRCGLKTAARNAQKISDYFLNMHTKDRAAKSLSGNSFTIPTDQFNPGMCIPIKSIV